VTRRPRFLDTLAGRKGSPVASAPAPPQTRRIAHFTRFAEYDHGKQPTSPAHPPPSLAEMKYFPYLSRLTREGCSAGKLSACLPLPVKVRKRSIRLARRLKIAYKTPTEPPICHALDCSRLLPASSVHLSTLQPGRLGSVSGPPAQSGCSASSPS